MSKSYRDLTPDQQQRVSGAMRARRELSRFEREQRDQDARDQRISRMDSGRSSRARDGYGIPW